ncbi:S-layer protein [Methanoregula sp.]|uniref:COG1361 S-layer family protein n=1 Tax=Methanoregula sp. TaxID=2052170 RepID=UPI002CF718EE|nr:S-layer protein [Methanoregula sp.]HVP96913.1 S-layer protein [Methanoregula sp.]
MKNYTTCAVLLLAAVLCVMPVLGQEKYLGGAPQVTAYIAGTNDFSPGEDATITVVIRNSGTNAVMFTDQGTLPQTDLPTTAKLVTAALSSGGAPINITTGTQALGDIPSPGVTTVSFSAKITSDADMGSYTLPLEVQYSYLSNSLAKQPASDEVQSVYTPVNVTIPLTVMIQPVVHTSVLGAQATDLAVGTEGYINLTLENTGYQDGTAATVKILQHGDSAIIPTDDSVYVGDFPRNGIVTCLYKVSVSNNAQQQTYPVDVEVTYTNSDGNIVTSATDTVGIPVAGKLTFAVVSPPGVITQGSDTVVNITYKNTGTITAHDAEARLILYGPLSGPDSLAYLGDIPPGGTVNARYAISSAGDAAPGNYPLNTEIRYRDDLDNSRVSDIFTANVTVAPRPPASPLVLIVGVIGIVIAAVLAVGYAIIRTRKKK